MTIIEVNFFQIFQFFQTPTRRIYTQALIRVIFSKQEHRGLNKKRRRKSSASGVIMLLRSNSNTLGTMDANNRMKLNDTLQFVGINNDISNEYT